MQRWDDLYGLLSYSQFLYIKLSNLPYTGATGWTDPHYLSFDGAKYTFRGEGEYTAMGLRFEGNVVFELQARIRGLYIISMAFGVPGVYGYQVRTSLS